MGAVNAADLGMDYAVRLDGITVRYDSADPVLDGVNLALTPGSFSFLTGPSGAGKTSLLRLIYLALTPTLGEVSLFGRRTSVLSRDQLSALRRRVGVVFQEFKLLDHLTVYENAALPLRVAGRKEADYRGDVEELLRWVGLGPRMRAYPATLSGGEQQRTAIARALVNKPDLLLADEPTGNVDPEMGARLMRLFVELNRRLNTTVIVATHDLGLIEEFNAPVLRLHHGLITKDTDLGAR
ncbi:MAG: ATP-binding cassette domain-containing protein [Pseudomonadota bacterium]